MQSHAPNLMQCPVKEHVEAVIDRRPIPDPLSVMIGVTNVTAILGWLVRFELTIRGFTGPELCPLADSHHSKKEVRHGNCCLIQSGVH